MAEGQYNERQSQPTPSQISGGTGSIDTEVATDSVSLSRAKSAYQASTGVKRHDSTGLREKRVPQRVVTADMVSDEPYSEDDIDDDTIIAPGKQYIGSTYTATKELKTPKGYIPIAESSSGDDVLSLQSIDTKSGQTISFKVKGIQWRAGYSNYFNKTPIGYAIHPLPLPSPNEKQPESIKNSGIVLRPVNPRLRVVLSQLLPTNFRKEANKMRGKCEKLRQLDIFYLPNPQSSSVGFIHEFVNPKTQDLFYLYIQTSVGKAPVAILDEVLKTLEAGLPEGEKADDYDYEEDDDGIEIPEKDFDFTSEVGQSMKQVSSTINDSIFVHGIRQGQVILKNSITEFLRVVDRAVAKFIRILTAILVMIANSWPIQLLAEGIKLIGTGIVRTTWFINKILLAIARSPITKAILNGLAQIFIFIGKIFIGIGWGIKYIFKGIATIFSWGIDMIKSPTEVLKVTFPTFKPELDESKKSKLKTSTKASSKGLAKPELKRKPVLARQPKAPKLKSSISGRTTSLKQKTVVQDSKKPVPLGSAQKELTEKQRKELGYFEDADF